MGNEKSYLNATKVKVCSSYLKSKGAVYDNFVGPSPNFKPFKKVYTQKLKMSNRLVRESNSERAMNESIKTNIINETPSVNNTIVIHQFYKSTGPVTIYLQLDGINGRIVRSLVT